MALLERTIQDKTTILPNGDMVIRHTTVIERDGVETGRSSVDELVLAGADVSSKGQLMRDIRGATDKSAAE